MRKEMWVSRFYEQKVLLYMSWITYILHFRAQSITLLIIMC